MTNATVLRHQLRDAGYRCIPLYGKEPPQYGKHGKGLKGWQNFDVITDEMLAMWDKIWPDAENTGVLTRLMPTLDADILDAAAAEACRAHIRDRYEDAGDLLFRTGKPPKFAGPFRTEEPFEKITVNLTAPDDSEGQKIEFLADGEQIVVAGLHPDINKNYDWSNGGLEQVPHNDLPYIREDEARELVDELVEILIRDHGYKRAPSRPKKGGNGAQPGNHATGVSADADWAFLYENIRVGHQLHDSITVLAAKLVATGANSGSVINQLRGLLESSEAPKDERWRERVAGIPRAVDSAVAKYGKKPIASPQSNGSPTIVDKPPDAATAEPTEKLAIITVVLDAKETAIDTVGISVTLVIRPRKLAEAHAVFQKWLSQEYDTDVLDAVLAAGAAEQLSGDPLWLLVISGPGNAKTETVQALVGAGAIITSTITSEGALLAATKKGGKTATGGLLRTLGDRGILVIKDVTTILSATDRTARGLVLSAIRENLRWPLGAQCRQQR